MGIYNRDGVWYVRAKDGEKLIRKKIGKGRAAEIAYKTLRNSIDSARAAGQEWTGLAEIQRAKHPKLFKEAAQDYLEERANYKPSTLAQYTSILKRYLLPEFEKIPLKHVTDSQLKRFQVRLSKEISPSRVNTVMQLLRSIFDQSQREGEIVRDPSKAVRRMQEPKVQIDPLSEEELALALSNIDSHYKPLFTALAFYGRQT